MITPMTLIYKIYNIEHVELELNFFLESLNFKFTRSAFHIPEAIAVRGGKPIC